MGSGDSNGSEGTRQGLAVPDGLKDEIARRAANARSSQWQRKALVRRIG